MSNSMSSPSVSGESVSPEKRHPRGNRRDLLFGHVLEQRKPVLGVAENLVVNTGMAHPTEVHEAERVYRERAGLAPVVPLHPLISSTLAVQPEAQTPAALQSEVRSPQATEPVTPDAQAANPALNLDADALRQQIDAVHGGAAQPADRQPSERQQEQLLSLDDIGYRQFDEAEHGTITGLNGELRDAA